MHAQSRIHNHLLRAAHRDGVTFPAHCAWRGISEVISCLLHNDNQIRKISPRCTWICLWTSAIWNSVSPSSSTSRLLTELFGALAVAGQLSKFHQSIEVPFGSHSYSWRREYMLGKTEKYLLSVSEASGSVFDLPRSLQSACQRSSSVFRVPSV
ncbi:hypothetical protein EYF80_008684 [Liparis tanakae]|uniref:Uncharacterized protein n=1 Tax=Liparis tanakae TaxID=230148 RepID=A0A4Z2ITW0_9TELE|nr:hypothetical protein EYF80_008684 [Liparis tanakae]